MNAEFTTIIGQLSIENNEYFSEAPNQVAVREPKSADAPGAGKGDLFIITEIQGEAENLTEMEQKLAESIRDQYYLARGSMTASLRRAVQAGGDLLFRYNRRVDVDKRVVGGAVVLVMSNEDAFVAQIGPTAFFAILGDHIQRYPPRSIWLDEALGPGSDDIVTGLGLNSVIEPALHHLRVTTDDVLLLADSRLAGQLPLKDVVLAVDTNDVKTSIKRLADVAKTRSGTALLLAVVEKTSTTAGPIKIVPTKSLSNLWPRRQMAAEPDVKTDDDSEPELVDEVFTETEARSPAIFASTATMVQKPLSWLGSVTSRRTPAADTPPIQTDELPLPKDDEPYEPEIEPEPVAEPEAPSSSYHYAVYDDEPHPHKSGGSRITKWFLTVVAMVGTALKRFFGLFVRSEDEPRQAGAQAQPPASGVSWKWLRNIAIAIPILVALIVGVSYLQKGQLREAEYQTYLTTAQDKFVQAQSVSDPASALGLMAEAESALIQAEQIKQDQSEITELRQQMATYTDNVTNVQRLYYLPQVRRYTDPGTTMSKLVVQGVEIYALDTGNDRVFRHRLDDLGDALLPDDETVLMTAKGQQVENITVGDLLGMTWMPTGGNRQTSDLVLLNSTGLLEFNPNWGITSAVLAGGEELVMPQAIDSYFGNLYILDPKANKLLRYLPTTDGYSAPPENYFAADQNVNLSQAIDMSIDGAIFVLFSDGRINKYLGGQPADFNLTGLDVPLNKPVAIYTAPDEEVQYLYVADAGNHRIVQLEKDGTFVRQFQPRGGEAVSFASLQDIYVDEIGGRLFVLDSNNLYLGKMPIEEGAPVEKTDASEADPAEAAPAEIEPAPEEPALVEPQTAPAEN
jgi:hypothetical protein